MPSRLCSQKGKGGKGYIHKGSTRRPKVERGRKSVERACRWFYAEREGFEPYECNPDIHWDDFKPGCSKSMVWVSSECLSGQFPSGKEPSSCAVAYRKWWLLVVMSGSASQRGKWWLQTKHLQQIGVAKAACNCSSRSQSRSRLAPVMG